MSAELAPGLPAHAVDEVIARALEEDLGALGDVTTLATILPNARTSADLVPRADGVVAGLPIAARVFETVGQGRVRIEYGTVDGTPVTGLETYAASVDIDTSTTLTSMPAATVLKIVVTVRSRGEPATEAFVLTGWRTKPP